MTVITTKTINITERHRRALMQVIDQFGLEPFRRADLAARIYPMTSPRSRERADAISKRC